MRMIEATEFGGPEVLRGREAPDPVPGHGDVLIEVTAADIGPFDMFLRAGQDAESFGLTPPFVPGAGVAGTVIALGDGADPGLLGARVVAATAELMNGYADRVVVPQDLPVRLPEEVDDRDAAALVNDAATAVDLIEAAAIRPGQWVLVVGATGAMGVLLVQFARNAGARVVAAARGARKLALARELGAEAAVDYSEPGWAERARAATGGGGAQVVLDGVGGDIGTAAFGVTADGGRFSAHGVPMGGADGPEPARIDQEEAARRGIDVRGTQDLEQDQRKRRRLLVTAIEEAAAGRLRPHIGQTFPLDRAADAHAAMEDRKVIGKTLLIP